MPKGERDLARLLADLDPTLSQERYAFEMTDAPALDGDTFALVREGEGVTAIRVSADGDRARISLGIHSSLDAVGLTAVISRALAHAGISANVVASLHHDHVFVPWDRRDEALMVLASLGN